MFYSTAEHSSLYHNHNDGVFLLSHQHLLIIIRVVLMTHSDFHFYSTGSEVDQDWCVDDRWKRHAPWKEEEQDQRTGQEAHRHWYAHV